MGLSLVPFQLSLPGFDFVSRVSSSADREKDKRSGREWLKSVHDFCLWRAGISWRKRQDPERWDFLDAAKLIADILSTGGKLTAEESAQAKKDAGAQAQLDIMRGAPIPLTLEEIRLSGQPRPALVRELMRDPLYTDARRLSHLAKNKLARMVVQSRQRRVADSEAERRSA